MKFTSTIPLTLVNMYVYYRLPSLDSISTCYIESCKIFTRSLKLNPQSKILLVSVTTMYRCRRETFLV